MISARIINHQSSVINRRRGIALLMVLLIVMAVTVIAAGFIARADVELASGENMLVRVQADQLANSGIEHAKGLLLRPQDVSATERHADDWYWLGAKRMRLRDDSHDYYDVNVTRDATDYQTYHIVSEAYRERGGERVGGTRLAAELRMDPCLGLWTKTNTTFRQNWVLCGDVCTQGNLVNQAPTASLDGDVFAAQLTGASFGQNHTLADLCSAWGVADLSLKWPPVTSGYVNPYYTSTAVSGTLSGSYALVRIRRCAGDLVLAANTTLEGMLVVTGNLTVAGSGCTINGARTLPALYVGGDLLLADANNLTVRGLAVVDGSLLINSGAHDIKFVGGLCLAGSIVELTPDASGNGRIGLIQGNPVWTSGPLDGALRLDGVDDYVDCGNDAIFDITDQITLAAWVKTERADVTMHEPFVTKGDHAYSLKHSRIGGNNIEFFVYAEGVGWQAARFGVGASFNGGWHHVAGTFDGGNVNLYIDGVLKSTQSYTGTIASRPHDRVFLGSDSEWLDRFYQGAIDDVRIYHRGLSEAEIGVIQSGGSAPNLLAQWRLDGPGSGVTIQADPVKAAVVAWVSGTPQQWTPAAGAFIRRIERQ